MSVIISTHFSTFIVLITKNRKDLFAQKFTLCRIVYSRHSTDFIIEQKKSIFEERKIDWDLG
jgi:hypothetical protein